MVPPKVTARTLAPACAGARFHCEGRGGSAGLELERLHHLLRAIVNLVRLVRRGRAPDARPERHLRGGSLRSARAVIFRAPAKPSPTRATRTLKNAFRPFSDETPGPARRVRRWAPGLGSCRPVRARWSGASRPGTRYSAYLERRLRFMVPFKSVCLSGVRSTLYGVSGVNGVSRQSIFRAPMRV